MRYAHTPPVEPGYYWLKEEGDEEIVEVWTDPAQVPPNEVFFIHRCGSGDFREVSSLKEVLWAGPIALPEPPVTDLNALRVEAPEGDVE